MTYQSAVCTWPLLWECSHPKPLTVVKEEAKEAKGTRSNKTEAGDTIHLELLNSKYNNVKHILQFGSVV